MCKWNIHTHTDYEIQCNLTFTLEGNTGQRQYKDILIPDDDFLNEKPSREFDITLGSTNPNVEIVESASSAVLVVVDNESML